MSEPATATPARPARRPPARPMTRPWFIRATDAFGRFAWQFFARVELRGLDHLRGPRRARSSSSPTTSRTPTPPLIGSFVTPALGRRIYWLGKQEALDWPVDGPVHRGATR